MILPLEFFFLSYIVKNDSNSSSRDSEIPTSTQDNLQVESQTNKDSNFFNNEDNSFTNKFDDKAKQKLNSDKVKFSNMAFEKKSNREVTKEKVENELVAKSDSNESSDILAATKNELEIQKLKLELEKTKLDLASTEKLIEEEAKASVKPSAVALPVVAKRQEAAKRVSSSRSAPSASLNSARKTTNTQSSFAAPTSSRSTPQVTQQTSPQARPSSAPVSNNTRASAKATGSSSEYASAGSSAKRGALLSGSSITNEQLSNESNSGKHEIRTVKSTEEINSTDQATLNKYYNEGTQFIVGKESLDVDALKETLLLEKDEESGLITVAKKKTALKRMPAMVPEVEKPDRQRKVFSYDEFKTILDSSREE